MINLQKFSEQDIYGTLANSCSTAQKMKFSINDFFSKCDQIRSFLLMKMR